MQGRLDKQLIGDSRVSTLASETRRKNTTSVSHSRLRLMIRRQAKTLTIQTVLSALKEALGGHVQEQHEVRPDRPLWARPYT